MKICFVSAGTFEHVQPYLDYFKREGHEVYFIALSPTPERHVPTIKCWVGDDKIKLKPSKWKYFVSALLARKEMRRIKPDIVHAHYATSGGLAAWVNRHPNTIISVHGTDVNEGVKSAVWKRLLPLFFKFAKKVHVVSTQLQKNVQKLGISEDKIVNLNIGIEIAQFQDIPLREVSMPGQTLRIICNRSFEAVYDHITILKAVKELKNRNIPFELTLIGDGSLKNQLKSFIEDNSLEFEVKFTGKLPYDAQLDYFYNNEIYLSASLSDGTSLSLLEGMFTGLYPIVTDIRANEEWIKNNYNGSLFQPTDYIGLANAFKNYYDNEVGLGKIAQINHELVTNKGNRKLNMERLKDVYLEMIKNEKNV